MLSLYSLQEISNIFCGDTAIFYKYKEGHELAQFFNVNFGTKDVYCTGLDERCEYVCGKLKDLINKEQIDRFLNIVLDKSYLIKEQSLSEVEASEKIEIILNEFNCIIHRDLCKITRSNGRYWLFKENEDLRLIGNGGFANVYLQGSTGLVVKKLKDEHLEDTGIRERFKREYDITKSMENMPGIIKVYTFDEYSSSYTMEYAGDTLCDYIKSNLSDDVKLYLIREILGIMTEVHKRNIIHRDISANNIFIISGKVKIADFGLGKDLKAISSYQTMNTNALGQFLYCAPEQYRMLKNADKRSDVYSLGCVINFIMTGESKNSKHIYERIVKNATNEEMEYRYDNAGQLYKEFEIDVSNNKKQKNKEDIYRKISAKICDKEVESYIYNLSEEQISREILNKKDKFYNGLLLFMKKSEGQALRIIQSVHKTYDEVCERNFGNYDPFADFAFFVLKENFGYSVNETAAEILKFIAKYINRYRAQDLVEKIKKIGVEPKIEEILDS